MKRVVLAMILGIVGSVSVQAHAAGAEVSYEQFSECVAATSWLMRGKDTHKIDEKKKVQIPDGWKVVGTGVIDETPVIFLCHQAN